MGTKDTKKKTLSFSFNAVLVCPLKAPKAFFTLSAQFIKALQMNVSFEAQHVVLYRKMNGFTVFMRDDMRTLKRSI